MFDLRDNNTVNVYIDDGYTAKNLNRPGMKKILDKVSNNQIKAIYIYKLDRLSRSVTDIYNMLTFFLDHNCDLNAIADNINIQSANGRLFIGILAIIAQWESEVISERTLNAIQEMVNQGNYPLGTVIFGYERHKKN